MSNAVVNRAGLSIECRRLVSAGYPPIVFPEIADRVSDAIFRGRNPAHGYARGWGLEYGGLEAQVAAHPLYQEAIASSRGRSVMHPHRLMNLFLIIACFFDDLEHHDIAEFGSYRGGSALFLAKLLQVLYPSARVFAHDTFMGMPVTDSTVDLHVAGDFDDVDFAGLQEAREADGLLCLHLVQGLVQETFPSSIPTGTRLGLVHLDMDIYEPTVFAQSRAWDMMARGGYLVYDDATVSSCIGATQAVEELVQRRFVNSEQVYPHFVFRAGLVKMGFAQTLLRLAEDVQRVVSPGVARPSGRGAV